MLHMSIGVLYMHQSNAVHLDLKPRNIVLDTMNTAKICDFGISKCIGSEQYASIQHKLTMRYAAPERFNKEKHKFEPDVWSLGVILYEMIFFKFLFDTTDMFLLVGEILHQDLGPKLEPLNKEYGGLFYELVGQMLEKDRKKRILMEDVVCKYIYIYIYI